ncbi:MAG: 3-deoxy-D-manno-octulosonic acid transferase [Alphaproteobacteria bacterium]
MIPLFLYICFSILFSPFILIWMGIRLYKGKEDKTRFYERFGHSTKVRPNGRLIWMHGASVGECLSMMPLINEILQRDKKVHIMVTSGTVTSAALMRKRLPQRAFHQYIPIDLPWAARAFVRHWQADAVLWFESDFWPNLLQAAAHNKRPVVLLNGRISDRSFERWGKAVWFIRPLLRLFTVCLGQTHEDAVRLNRLGAKEAICVGNLKFAAAPAPFNQAELDMLLSQISSRPRCLAASTHEGEEEMIAGFHADIKRVFPAFLSVIAPRHPERAEKIAESFTKRGLKVARRSLGEKITADTDLYLADTIGEMGLIYRLASIVFVGGSLVPFGGQNMLEPMRLGRVVLVGPYTFNFREIVKDASEKGALIQVQTASELLGNAVRFLSHPEEHAPIIAQGQAFALSQTTVLERIYNVLHEREIV